MPQKRNPFLLEHVQGRSARAAGSFVGAMTAMHATPFANSVAVGTEGCAGAVEALEATADCAALLRLVVAGAKPQPPAMLARAVAGRTTATARAERLMIQDGLSFREAHRLVGARLTEADRRSALTPVVDDERPGRGDGVDPAAVVGAARFGGGPGAPPAFDDLRHRRAAFAAELGHRLGRHRRADVDLAAAVAAVIASAGVGPVSPLVGRPA